MAELGVDGGWLASADAWIRLVQDHATRTLLLDAVLLAEAGNVEGRLILDLGCGEGRFSRLLSARGATAVGLDPILPMLQAARRAGGSERYIQGTGESLPFANAHFDLVVAYLSLVDITDYRAAITEAARVLKRGGRLITANVSNLASTSEAPVRDENGRFLHYTVDRYLDEWPMTLQWAGLCIRNWHRPLSAYMEAYLTAGLILRRYLEPVPQDESLRDEPRFESWFRVPSFDTMVWEKT